MVLHRLGSLQFNMFSFHSQIQGTIHLFLLFPKKFTFFKFSAHFQNPFTFITAYALKSRLLTKAHEITFTGKDLPKLFSCEVRRTHLLPYK